MRHFFRIHAICDYFRIQEQSCFIPLISFKVKIPIHYMIYLKLLNQDNNSTVYVGHLRIVKDIEKKIMR